MRVYTQLWIIVVVNLYVVAIARLHGAVHFTFAASYVIDMAWKLTFQHFLIISVPIEQLLRLFWLQLLFYKKATKKVKVFEHNIMYYYILDLTYIANESNDT